MSTVKTPIAQPYLCTNQSLTCSFVHRTIATQMRVIQALSALVNLTPRRWYGTLRTSTACITRGTKVDFTRYPFVTLTKRPASTSLDH